MLARLRADEGERPLSRRSEVSAEQDSQSIRRPPNLLQVARLGARCRLQSRKTNHSTIRSTPT